MSIIRSLNTVYTAIGICNASSVDCLLGRSGYITMHGPLNVKILSVIINACTTNNNELPMELQRTKIALQK